MHFKFEASQKDQHRRGDVIGIEFVGIKKFDLSHLLKMAPLKVPPSAIEQTSYISADLHRAST